MSANTPSTTDDLARIRAEAADWLVRRSEDGKDAETEAAFNAWRQADPRHARQYAEMSALWGSLTEWDELRELEPLQRASLWQRWQDWRARRAEAREGGWGGLPVGNLAAAVAVVLLLVGGPFVLPQLLDQGPAQESVVAQIYETAEGEIRDVALADGSVITLGAASRVSVALSDGRRDVTLRDGEAFFTVSPDKSRPFFVRARGANVRVVGTEFSVSLGEATTRVSVLSGIVDVARDRLPGNRAARGEIRLVAGQGVVASRDGTSAPLVPVAVNQVADWRSGRLAYEDAYLVDILADISRYSPLEFDLENPSIGQIRVTAAFRADDAASAVPTILRGLDLASSEDADGVLHIRRPE